MHNVQTNALDDNIQISILYSFIFLEVKSMQNVVLITVHCSFTFRCVSLVAHVLIWKTNEEMEQKRIIIIDKLIKMHTAHSARTAVASAQFLLFRTWLQTYRPRIIILLKAYIDHIVGWYPLEVASWRPMSTCLFIGFDQSVDDNHLKWNDFMGIYSVDFVLHYPLISHTRRWRSLINDYLFELKSNSNWFSFAGTNYKTRTHNANQWFPYRNAIYS